MDQSDRRPLRGSLRPPFVARQRWGAIATSAPHTLTRTASSHRPAAWCVSTAGDLCGIALHHTRPERRHILGTGCRTGDFYHSISMDCVERGGIIMGGSWLSPLAAFVISSHLLRRQPDWHGAPHRMPSVTLRQIVPYGRAAAQCPDAQ